MIFSSFPHPNPSTCSERPRSDEIPTTQAATSFGKEKGIESLVSRAAWREDERTRGERRLKYHLLQCLCETEEEEEEDEWKKQKPYEMAMGCREEDGYGLGF